MKKTRIFCIILALVMMLSLFAGCGKEEAPAAPAEPAAPAAPAEPAAPTTPEKNDEPAAQEEPTVLVFAHTQADTSDLAKCFEAAKARLEEISGGAMSLEIVGNSALIDNATALAGIQDGICDGGFLMSSNASGMIPQLNLLTIPGYYSGDQWVDFANDIWEPLNAVYEQYGLHLFGANYQNQSIFLNNKAQITAPADCKGMLIRASGNYLARAIESWGSASTILPMTDIATSLERGTIDGCYFSWSLANAQKFYELADYITITSAAETWANTVINLDVYNGLSDQEKAWIDQIGQEFAQMCYDTVQPMRDKVVENFEGAGCEVKILTAEETAAFTELCKPMFDEFAGQTDELGLAMLEVVYQYNGWEMK